jgi:hypothetical protein
VVVRLTINVSIGQKRVTEGTGAIQDADTCIPCGFGPQGIIFTQVNGFVEVDVPYA